MFPKLTLLGGEMGLFLCPYLVFFGFQGIRLKSHIPGADRTVPVSPHFFLLFL